ncbi:MAG: lytic transglycosylase domain-containing protein [Methylococcaceae bacterium]|nr:lytic transglycosylase domain-containing protein [Methylococcaceae bacterium]
MQTKILKRTYRDAFNIPLFLLAGAGITQLHQSTPIESADYLLVIDSAENGTAAAASSQIQKVKVLTNFIQDKFNISQSKASTIVAEAFRNGIKRDLQPELILAVIAVESTFREKAVSSVGARGLMQVDPTAHPKKVKSIGGLRALYDPKKNISVGTHILAQYLNLSAGNLRRTLLRYNGSLGDSRSRYPEKVLRVYNQMRNTAKLGEQFRVAQLERSSQKSLDSTG